MTNTQQIEQKIPKMRTIEGSYALLKKYDPNTSISKHFIRQLVLNKKVKHCMSGGKYLLNFDSLLEYLSNPPNDEDNLSQSLEYGKIRPIKSC